MAGKSVEPSSTLTSFNCPHCSSLAQQWWLQLYAEGLWGKAPHAPVESAAISLQKALGTDAVTEKPVLTAGVMAAPSEPRIRIFDKAHPPRDGAGRVADLHLSRCGVCAKIAVWVGGGIVFPPTGHGTEPNPDLPKDVLADYDEARSILQLSPRGAAALLRLAIQKLCKELGEKGKNIDDDIASLVEKGLSKRVQQALDVVRVIGNEAVHPGTIDLKDDQTTAAALFGLVNLIAEKMISEPKHVDALYNKLPAKKRAAIEERDKKPSK
jgi:hypothetical protein